MLTWYVSDLKTGDFIEEMPFRFDGVIENTVGQKLTISVSLDVADPSCPPAWNELLRADRTLVVPVDDGIPLTAYVITDAPEIGDPTVPFTLQTLEWIAENQYVESLEFFEGEDDEAYVAARLLEKVATGWGFTIDWTATGQSADHAYSFYEDRTIGSAISDLSSQRNGPEVAYRIAWEDETQRRFVKTIEIGPQIGNDRRSTIFEDTHLARRIRKRSWQKLAVRTIATGDGVGESRPMSEVIVDDVAIAAGVPPWEARTAASSIDTTDGLNRVATEYALKHRYGTQTWELTIAQTTAGAPRLVTDYDIGDTVTVDLGPRTYTAADGHVVYLDPASWHGPARLIGWRAKVQGRFITEVTPVLWNPDEEDA